MSRGKLAEGPKKEAKECLNLLLKSTASSSRLIKVINPDQPVSQLPGLYSTGLRSVTQWGSDSMSRSYCSQIPEQNSNVSSFYQLSHQECC